MALAAAGACATALAQNTPPAGETEQQQDQTAAGSRAAWLPIPFLITEPAIGVGLGAALAYFHPRAAEPGDLSSPSTPQAPGGSGSGQKRPPDISGVAVAYTDTDTWAAGIGHSASWRRDRIRYTGALAYTNVNTSFYVLDRTVDFNLKGGGLYQDLKLRVGSSDLFVGGKLFWMDTQNTFRLEGEQGASLPPGQGDSRDAGIAVQGYFDTRDNTFTPNRGQLVTLDVWRYDEALGGDFDYWRGNFRVLSFHQLHRAFVLGLRLDVSAATGDPPFYGYPWITLRGVPAMRYQNERVGVAEVEARWNFLPRWAVVGFAGTGATDGNTRFFENAHAIGATGAGLRYSYLPALGLWVGADVAWGPEEATWYIQVGQAW